MSRGHGESFKWRLGRFCLVDRPKPRHRLVKRMLISGEAGRVEDAAFASFEVFGHELGGEVGLARDDSGDDGFVLGGGFGGASAVGVGDAKDDLVNLVAKALHGGKDFAIAEIRSEQEVHALIQVHQGVEIVFGECPMLVGEVELEFFDLKSVKMACESANGPGLDGFAQFIVIDDVLNAHTADDDALLGGNGDKTFGFESLQSDMNRCFGHAELSGELALRQERAGWEFAGDDEAAELAVSVGLESGIGSRSGHERLG